jgi:hypothetical protein
VQNNALRIAAACHKKTPITHFHTETKVLPAEAHSDILCKQFLANTMTHHHPLNTLVNLDSGPLNMKHILQSRHGPSIQQHIRDGFIPESSSNRVISDLHLAAVADVICRAGLNEVLGF